MALSISFYHNTLSFLYCLILLPVICEGVINQNYIQYEFVFWLSMAYFAISIILNCFEKQYLFILHHCVVIYSLYLPYLSNYYDLYVEFMYCGLVTEISTIILAAKFIVKESMPSYYEKIKETLDTIFMTSFILVRMCWLQYKIFYNLIPQLNYEDDKINTITTYSIILVMLGLNYYWTCMMAIKLGKIFMKTKLK